MGEVPLYTLFDFSGLRSFDGPAYSPLCWFYPGHHLIQLDSDEHTSFRT